tara:strand:- start:418 stop:1680 length:1263 start_codon:yes stop_codon:yes gene_type:complete
MLFQYSIKNITTKPLSSGLSVLLMAVSIMIIVLANLTMSQLSSKFNENANKVDLVVGSKGSRMQLVLCNVFHIDQPTGNIPMKSVQFIENHPFVSLAVPISLGDNYKKFRIVGTRASFINELYDARINEGKIFDNSLEVVVGSKVAKELNLNIGSTFTGSHGIGESIHDHGDFEYEVVGILEQTGEVIDQLLLTPLESVWDVHPDDHQKGTFELSKNKKDTHEHHHDHHHDHSHQHEKSSNEITSLLVKYNSPRGKFTLPGSINKKSELMAAEPAIEIQQLFELIQPAVDILIRLSWIIFGLAMISVFITLLNSMKDRKYEIAMMRAGGASSKKIFISVIFESIIISLIGSVLGVFLGHTLMELLSGLVLSNYNYDFSGFLFYPVEFLFILGSLFIGMISALYPAYSAYKINIAQTLKQS